MLMGFIYFLKFQPNDKKYLVQRVANSQICIETTKDGEVNKFCQISYSFDDLNSSSLGQNSQKFRLKVQGTKYKISWTSIKIGPNVHEFIQEDRNVRFSNIEQWFQHHFL